MTQKPLITVVVPSYQQGQFLEAAIESIVSQQLPIELMILDGGSTDESVDIIKRWAPHITYWRSHKDKGQSNAINEGIAKGSAPYVCWLNSDDWFLAEGLATLVAVLEQHPDIPMVYGRVWNVEQTKQKRSPIWVEPFSERRLALRCIISQPGTLIRRTVWEGLQGLNESLHMVMDYDLWWRVFKQYGEPKFIDTYVAVNREHDATKTNTKRALHYQEAIRIIGQHHGSVPLKWWLYQPYAVWFKTLLNKINLYMNT